MPERFGHACRLARDAHVEGRGGSEVRVKTEPLSTVTSRGTARRCLQRHRRWDGDR